MARSLTEQLAGRCKHFTGVSNKCCAKGIEYETVRSDTDGQGYQWPCVFVSYKTHAEFIADVTCPARELPTPEEAEINAHFEKTCVARAAIVDHSNKFFVRELGGDIKGLMPCPNCSKPLHYSVAGCNGHIHAKCETEGCVSFME